MGRAVAPKLSRRSIGRNGCNTLQLEHRPRQTVHISTLHQYRWIVLSGGRRFELCFSDIDIFIELTNGGICGEQYITCGTNLSQANDLVTTPLIELWFNNKPRKTVSSTLINKVRHLSSPHSAAQLLDSCSRLLSKRRAFIREFTCAACPSKPTSPFPPRYAGTKRTQRWLSSLVSERERYPTVRKWKPFSVQVPIGTMMVIHVAENVDM